MCLWMGSTVGSRLLLWLLGLKFSTMVVDPAVLQVFCGYETIQACWDWRRTDRRVSTLGRSPQRHLLLRECFVVGIETFITIMVVVVYVDVGITAILL